MRGQESLNLRRRIDRPGRRPKPDVVDALWSFLDFASLIVESAGKYKLSTAELIGSPIFAPPRALLRHSDVDQ
jgi:hypothetical protein